MVKIKMALIVLAVILGGIFLIRHFFPSDKSQILERYESLSRWISLEAEESLIEAAQRMRHLPLLFAEICIIKANREDLSGDYAPRELAEIVARARARFRELSLRFYDMDIRFPGADAASVTLTARLRGVLKNGDMVDEMREVESQLKKVEREWRFTRIEVVEVLEK